MKIRCKIDRKGGSFVPMSGGIEYHFAPNAAGDHVAEVEDESHIARFLSLTEGFEAYEEGKPTAGHEPAPGEGQPSDFEKLLDAEDLDLSKMTYEELAAEFRRLFGAKAKPPKQYDALLAKLKATRIPQVTKE